MIGDDFIIDREDTIVITGSNGFIGTKVVETLLKYGFRNLRCFTRPSSDLATLNKIIESSNYTQINVIKGNLLLREDCEKAATGVSVVYHLAAGMGNSFPGAYMNSVVTTKNLLDAVLNNGHLKRFLNVSSFAVYSNMKLGPRDLLDETCEVEKEPHLRGEAYCYGKVRQEELLLEYHRKHGIPYVIVRPGAVYGPGSKAISGRVGLDTFGTFLHLGGSNKIPFTYVSNCADAVVLAGLKKGVEGEVFNIVDDDLPTSSEFLKMYKRNVRHFKSIYVPKTVSYFLCYLWEKYSKWSKGQLPPAFNRKRWSTTWKGNQYTNAKLKTMLGWQPTVPLDEGLKIYFEYCRKHGASR